MSEERKVEQQPGVENSKNSSEIRQKQGTTRRDFLQKTAAAASAVALSSLLPSFVLNAANAQMASCATTGQPLRGIMEIQSSSTTKTLQAVIKILNEEKSYLAPSSTSGSPPVCNIGQMRYFSAYDPRINNPPVWPNSFNIGAVPTPGPTLRARVGDTVQITLLNQVNVSDFGNTLDVAESGEGCDVTTSVGPDGSVNTYPGDPSFETPPNCFHGSSSTNLHYHGTHVSPSSISDNVLINLRPSPRIGGQPVVDEQSVKQSFDQIFSECSNGFQPRVWEDLPLSFRTTQERLLKLYDKTAPWKGGNGLPPEEQLWPKDEDMIDKGEWPQYYVGAYPSCLRIPTWNGQPTSMGQSPGTHWYHAHKHGSTALNLANGMAGALIIEGVYDDTLKPFFTKQQVLVLQQFGAQLGLLRNAINANKNVNADLVFVNGQYTPVLQMNPNEMQLWRIVNACHQKSVPLSPPTGIKWVQTAQDGVQLNPKNYNPAVTNAAFPVPAAASPATGSMAPANRIDLLVQAPSTSGTFNVTFGSTLLFTVEVKQDPKVPAIPSPMPFPTQTQFPAMPEFLGDIDPSKVTVRRELHFASVGEDPLRAKNRQTVYPYAPPRHTINGKQFENNVIDQTMMLGATEEWTLYNDTPGAAHPFHIHINPFQVTEIFNPANGNLTPVKLPTPWIWWDNFAIPPAFQPDTSKPAVPGYVKMLTRFVDYTGIYVLHCHILGHEDRGMMQLVQVVTNTTSSSHH